MKNINLANITNIDESVIKSLSEQLESLRLECVSDEDYTALNAVVANINNKLFSVAVQTVAHGDSIFPYLLSRFSAPQFKTVARTEKGNCIALKDDNKIVQYSDTVRYIRKHNKTAEKAEQLIVPFTNADYVLFNLYGANLAKEQLSALDVHSLKVLAEFNSDLECFSASSNSKLKEQLQILFNRVSELAGYPNTVNAIERHSKLIAMELIRYKGIKHTVTISNADKLIDFIVCQYLVSRDKLAITVKSGLECHKPAKDK